jgi:hypothetical protein
MVGRSVLVAAIVLGLAAPAGAHWSEPLLVAPPSTDLLDTPKLGQAVWSGNGTLIAAWVGRQLFAGPLSAPGPPAKTFGDESRWPPALIPTLELAADTSGDAVLAWTTGENVKAAVALHGAFGPPQVLYDPPKPTIDEFFAGAPLRRFYVSQPRIAIHGSDLLVVWTETADLPAPVGKGRLWLATGALGGNFASAPVPNSPDVYGPLLGMDATGDALVLALTPRPAGVLVFRRSSSGTVRQLKRLTNGGVHSLRLSVASSGQAAAAWIDAHGSVHIARGSVARGFGLQRRVARHAMSGVSVATDDLGRSLVVWRARSGRGSRVMASYLDPERPAKPPRQLSGQCDGRVPAAAPVAALTAGGRAVAAWNCAGRSRMRIDAVVERPGVLGQRPATVLASTNWANKLYTSPSYYLGEPKIALGPGETALVSWRLGARPRPRDRAQYRAGTFSGRIWHP